MNYLFPIYNHIIYNNFNCLDFNKFNYLFSIKIFYIIINIHIN